MKKLLSHIEFMCRIVGAIFLSAILFTILLFLVILLSPILAMFFLQDIAFGDPISRHLHDFCYHHKL